jgi:PAS domain S-box-containing protein
MDLEQAHSILERAYSAFVSIDADGRISFWNARAEETFGLTREQAIGRPVAETIIPERYREAHWQGLRRFRQTGEGRMLGRRVELSALRADGSEFPIEMTISALREGQGWSFHAFVADISERRRAELERQRLLEELQAALAGSEQRFAVILDALAEAVTIRGPDDHLIYANAAALERLGLETVEQLRQADPRGLMAGWETTSADGEPIAMDDLPSVRLLRGEDPEPLLLRSVSRKTGEEEWVLLKATAVRDPAGAIAAAVTVIENVTEETTALLRLRFLARASEILASSLDYQQTLRNVAGLAVPQIADWCTVDLFDDQGRRRESVAIAHADPAKLELAERMRAYESDELDPNLGLGLMLQTGEPLLYADIPEELLEYNAVNEEHLRLLRAVGLRSAVIVPMRVRGRTIGGLTLVTAESGRTFDSSHVEFAGQIAERAAVAVENARLYSERSQVAQTLQRSLMPDSPPEIPGWEVACLYRPAGEGDGIEVGGDFYDFWEVDGQWVVMLGDVTGKGVAAAAVTSLVRHSASTASEFDAQPERILARVDSALKRRPSLSLCTALCLRLHDGGGVTIAAGGHPLPLHVDAEGAREVGLTGTLLGAFPLTRWPESRLAMRDGETLVAITDGVTDTLGHDGERFGMDRLQALLGEVHGAPAEEVSRRLGEAIDGFRAGPAADDTAVVVMRYRG